jgi:hypothetical protein
MDLTDEAGRASTRRAEPALGYLPATPIADLAGTDTKVVFVARHETTIGSRTLSRKAKNAVCVLQRRNTCAGEDTWGSAICSLSRATALGALIENDNQKKRRSPISMER